MSPFGKPISPDSTPPSSSPDPLVYSITPVPRLDSIALLIRDFGFPATIEGFGSYGHSEFPVLPFPPPLPLPLALLLYSSGPTPLSPAPSAGNWETQWPIPGSWFIFYFLPSRSIDIHSDYYFLNPSQINHSVDRLGVCSSSCHRLRHGDQYITTLAHALYNPTLQTGHKKRKKKKSTLVSTQLQSRGRPIR